MNTFFLLVCIDIILIGFLILWCNYKSIKKIAVITSIFGNYDNLKEHDINLKNYLKKMI